MKGALQRFLVSRFRISTQLYLGIGGAVTLTFIASLIGWLSFKQVEEVQGRVNEHTVLELAAAFAIAQQSGALVAAAPRLTAATMPEDLAHITTAIAEERKAFEDQLAAPMWRGIDEARFERVHAHGGELISNLEIIEASVAEHFALLQRRTVLRTQLEGVQSELTRILVPAIDDQLFYAMTGYRRLGEPPAPRDRHFSDTEFIYYRHLADLQSGVTIAIQLMGSAFTLSDGDLLEPLRESFEATADGVERSLKALGDVPVSREVAPIFARLFALSLGEGGGFNLRARELALTEQQQRLLADNRNVAVELVTEVEGLVKAARSRARQATRDSTQTMRTGRNLLLVLNVVGIVGAALIAWLLVGRGLLQRLGRLLERMRRLASGDLASEVEISGRDELAEMAGALEIFRRHALEVQRLNLVERLVEKLKDKNAQLESTLADLRKLQDQIVMREKLAALGELTAGVAHEIKNPLNFVKNFSEVSEELLEELREILCVNVKALDEGQRKLIEEIMGDLSGNFDRIHEHGGRANQIVQHMLMMGGGSGERQATDLNALLNEHAQLAYHSARASDASFRLEITEDFDPRIGEIEIVPQAMGRVFLNIVSNACQATDEKRRRLESIAGGDGSVYKPSLQLTTRRLTVDRIEIRLRDNGSGIAPDVIEKIFNPFFTTKPVDQGTGLGLALSSDIVREHGGSIGVTTEPDVYTEMLIELPVALEGTARETPPSASPTANTRDADTGLVSGC